MVAVPVLLSLFSDNSDLFLVGVEGAKQFVLCIFIYSYQNPFFVELDLQGDDLIKIMLDETK